MPKMEVQLRAQRSQDLTRVRKEGGSGAGKPLLLKTRVTQAKLTGKRYEPGRAGGISRKKTAEEETKTKR